MQQNRNILSEVLLELTLVIGNELEYEKIHSKTISLWLRRLNCTAGAIIIAAGKNNFEIEYMVPTYMKKKGIKKEILEFFVGKNINVCTEYCDDNTFHYVFPLGPNRYFYFVRVHKLTREQSYELFPVTQFFGKALDNALERRLRLAAEHRLEDEKRLLKTVIDHIPDSIYLKDPSLNKVLANKAEIVFAGPERDTYIIQNTDTDAPPTKLSEEFEDMDLHVLRSGQPIINRELQITNKDGDQRWVTSSKFPFLDNDGHTLGIVGVCRDTTEEKKSQENIKRLSLVASQTTNGVVITGVDGKIEWVNEGFTRMTGYSLSEVLKKHPGKLLQGQDSDPEVIHEMGRAIRNEESYETEIINYRKDGAPFWIHINCNPLRDENGELRGYMAIETDISEKVIFREELIQAKNIAEKAQLAEKTFLANMSHEIRTPLNAIIGMTSLLKDTSPTLEQKEYLDALDHSSRFLLRLINDVLDLAKIESGKIEPIPTRFNFPKLLRNIVQVFQPAAKKKNIDLALDIDPKMPEYVISDPMLLEQALNNLISNAVKFTESGSIKISINILSTLQSDHFINIIVKDTGVGMHQEDLASIFNKFRQGSATNDEHKGTGLGLSITKELIDILNGRISASSDKSKGSTFSVFLTVKKAEEQKQELKPEVLSVITADNKTTDLSTKVLIVEDNLMNQKYLTRLLEKWNINYDLANDGSEAIEHCTNNHYCLIFMDLQMPVMDGYEATQKIRQSSTPNSNIPIIALTASALSEEKSKALRYKMDEFLPKPFAPKQLYKKLSKYIAINQPKNQKIFIE